MNLRLHETASSPRLVANMGCDSSHFALLSISSQVRISRRHNHVRIYTYQALFTSVTVDASRGAYDLSNGLFCNPEWIMQGRVARRRSLDSERDIATTRTGLHPDCGCRQLGEKSGDDDEGIDHDRQLALPTWDAAGRKTSRLDLWVPARRRRTGWNGWNDRERRAGQRSVTHQVNWAWGSDLRSAVMSFTYTLQTTVVSDFESVYDDADKPVG